MVKEESLARSRGMWGGERVGQCGPLGNCPSALKHDNYSLHYLQGEGGEGGGEVSDR